LRFLDSEKWCSVTIIEGVERHSSTFVRDICRQRDYYHGFFDTWLVGVLSYAPNLDYLIPSHDYIPFYIYTLPYVTINGA